jgi:Uma2 family endonuclease
VLIEVISASTEEHDRGFKLTHYRKIPALQEILFFSQNEPQVDHYVRQKAEQWLLTPISGREAAVEFPSIGCRIPMQQIYAGVEFGESPQNA